MCTAILPIIAIISAPNRIPLWLLSGKQQQTVPGDTSPGQALRSGVKASFAPERVLGFWLGGGAAYRRFGRAQRARAYLWSNKPGEAYQTTYESRMAHARHIR